MKSSDTHTLALEDIAVSLILLLTHFEAAQSLEFTPATLAKIEASMSKVQFHARRIYQAALDIQVECGAEMSKFEKETSQ